MKEIVCENDIMQSIKEEMKKKNLYLNKRNLNILKEAANRLFNRLTKGLKYNANVTIIAKKQEDANLYGEILGTEIEKLTKTFDKGRIVDEKGFFELSKWKEECQTILLVKDYKGDKPEELFRRLVDIEDNGWLPAVILCMTEENVEKLKNYKEQDDRLYHYLCGVKIFVSEVNDNDIYDCTLKKLENGGFTWTDAFSTRLADYIDTVYPEACTKKEIFVDDLIERIYQVYSGRISFENKLDVGDVPYSRKVKVALKKREEGTKEEISDVVQETDFTDLKNRKNVLILSMSTLPRNKKLYQYYIIEKDDSGKKKYQTFSGVSQLEPGTKYFLSKLAREGEKPDEIIILTTEETWKKGEEKSAVDVYSENIVQFLKYNEDPGVGEELKDALGHCKGIEKLDLQADFSKWYSLDEKSEISSCKYCGDDKYKSEYLDELNQYFTVKPILLDENSLFEISEELNSLLSSENLQSKKEGVNLFIDLQGGTRTYMFTLFAALTLWRDKDVKIKDMFATKFDPSKKYHPIESVSREYAMIDLVSGIRAFTRYGKVGELKQYIETRGNSEESVKKLLEIMQDIDGYMQINNPEDFRDRLKELLKVEWENNQAENKAINEIPEGCLLDKEKYEDNQFKLIVDDLKETYAPIILNHPSDLDIIKWFGEKEFTTSALTFIEDKIPGWMIGKSKGSIIQIKFSQTNKEIVYNYKNYGAQSYYKEANNIFHAVFKKIIQDQENAFYKKCCKDWANLLITNIKKTNKKSEQSEINNIEQALYFAIFEKNIDINNEGILRNLVEILQQVDGKYFRNIGVENDEKFKCWMSDGQHPIAYNLWLKLMSLKSNKKVKDIKEKVQSYVVDKNSNSGDRSNDFESKMDTNNSIDYALAYCKYRDFLNKTSALNNYRYNREFNENCSYKNLMLYQDLGYQEEFKEFFPYRDTANKVITTIAGVDDGEKNNGITITIGQNEDKRKLLNVCILLYQAMKSERNATNHATERSNHMHYRYTQKAIKVFVELCEKLLDISKKGEIETK